MKKSDITVSKSGEYYYIADGDSDADTWPQFKDDVSPEEEIIIRLCEKVVQLQEDLVLRGKQVEVAVNALDTIIEVCHSE